ncbi:MAG: hypothetical protein KAX44_04605 [Candidatus Brocadiae bacterium]|nr:hypothetical protein [Candidatus Brocadiia bacterium]
MRRHVLATVIVLAIAAGAAWAMRRVPAGPGPGPDPGPARHQMPGPGFGPPPAPQMHQPQPPMPVPQRPDVEFLLAHTGELDLSADQIKELKDLRLRLRLQAIELQAGRSKAQVQLEAALDEKDVDLESVKKLLHEAGTCEIELRYLAIETAVKAKRVLTDGQIERLNEMLRPARPLPAPHIVPAPMGPPLAPMGLQHRPLHRP